jgi:hypothetical protein
MCLKVEDVNSGMKQQMGDQLRLFPNKVSKIVFPITRL